jgi:hypothetical protein
VPWRLSNICNESVCPKRRVIDNAPASEPEALLEVLRNAARYFKRIGLEAGPLSQWLYSALAEAGLPVICVETRHMWAALKAQINKTDRNDARGIAQMMRVGLYRPVHVKTLRSQKNAVDPSQAFAGEGHRRAKDECGCGGPRLPQVKNPGAKAGAKLEMDLMRVHRRHSNAEWSRPQ